MTPTILDSEQLWKRCGRIYRIEKSSKIYNYSLIFATAIRNSIVKYAAYGLKRRVTVKEFDYELNEGGQTSQGGYLENLKWGTMY